MRNNNITEDELSMVGKDVEASINGVDWFKGRLEEVIDLFVPYLVFVYELNDVRGFTQIREIDIVETTTDEELIIGKNAATFLVEHMIRMGSCGVSIPVTVGGVEYKAWCGINTELEDFKKELREKGTIKEAYLEQQISATQQKLEAAEAQTAPLRREVTRLHSALATLLDAGEGEDDTSFYSACRIANNVLQDTQATALAYELEVKAKALEDAANNLEESEETPYSNMASTQLLRMADKLRAANKGDAK